MAASSRCFREVRGGGVEFRFGGGHFRFGRFHLGLRLTDVFRTRRYAHQPELRFGGGLLRLRARDGERQVRRIEREDAGAGFHAIAFLHVEREDAAAHLGREAHFGGFDVARDAELIGVARRRAGNGERKGSDRSEQTDAGHRVESLASMLRAVRRT